jgi:outer membrane protein assembly factor BamB
MNGSVQDARSVWCVAGGDGTRCGLWSRPVRLGNRVVRRLRAQAAVQASPVFDRRGSVYVADMSGGVQAFRLSGELQWRTKLAGGISATPAVHLDEPWLFVGTHLGRVYALDTATGRILWQQELPSQTDPRIVSDLLWVPKAGVVVTSSWAGRFVALDTRTGTIWGSWDAGLWPATGAAADQAGLIYCLRAVAQRGLELVRVSPGGQEIVLHQAPEPACGAGRMLTGPAPVLDAARQVVYFVANGDRAAQLCAWSLETDTLLWTRQLPYTVRATPALRTDGVVLVADLGGGVQAVQPDGTLGFRYHTGTEYLLAGPVCEAEGTCWVADPTGVLHEVNRAGQGRRVVELDRAVQARPAFDPTGNLYVPCTDRTVYGLAGRTAAMGSGGPS